MKSFIHGDEAEISWKFSEPLLFVCFPPDRYFFTTKNLSGPVTGKRLTLKHRHSANSILI